MTCALADLSDEEAQAAHNGIQFHQREIASLDAKIASLLGAVDILRDLKEEHMNKLRMCESVLTLARRLPPELQGQIFEYCVDLYPPAPLIVSQVCASWRAAAHSTPRIWTRLFIDCARPRSAEKAAHWIRMSGGHLPLRISLIPHDVSLHSVMQVLLPRAARWQFLTVDAVLPSHAREILEYVRARKCLFPILEGLDFTVQAEIQGVLDLQKSLSHRQCPRLHSVRLQSESWPNIRLPSHITVLSLAMPVLRLPTEIHLQIIQLLRDLPELRSFSLEFSDDTFSRDSPESAGDVMLVMQHLRTLVLTGCHQLFEVLIHLTLPSLCHLGLRETGKETSRIPRTGPYLPEMIARSFPPLRTLELHGIDATDSDFMDCFMRLATLEEIILHDSDISDAVFRRFCFPALDEGVHDTSWICPQLKRLDLRWCSQLSGKVLFELVKSRIASPHTSRVFEVVAINCSFVRQEDVLSLAALTTCRLRNRAEDFCYHRGCCLNNRFRHRFMLRHAAELRQERGEGRLEL